MNAPLWTTLIQRFNLAVGALDLPLAGPDVERLAVDVGIAMSGPLRRFHTPEHLSRFAPRDGIEAVAVLYHDVVYWSVDQSWPGGFETLAQVTPTPLPGARLALHADIPFYDEVLAVFGLAPGGELAGGANELFSALALATALGTILDRERLLEASACIEATIPFRGSACRTVLRDRLVGLGWTVPAADAAVERAVHMANQDVGDFCLEDPGLFLGGTWNLLPELNPELRVTSVFTIKAYRKALEATDRFFAFLKPDLLFEAWGAEPGEAVLAKWKAQAASNLAVARDYLWAKLFASALLEALAQATGPDVPLSLFMGAASDPAELRLEGLLPHGKGPKNDPVYQLLDQGRSTHSSFDLTNSPLAAWIYRQVSAEERARQRDRSREFFAGTLSAVDYLAGWPSVVKPLAQALGQFVPTRREGLRAFGA